LATGNSYKNFKEKIMGDHLGDVRKCREKDNNKIVSMKWYLEAGSCEQGSGSIKGEES
jgi:hypothetical protein